MRKLEYFCAMLFVVGAATATESQKWPLTVACSLLAIVFSLDGAATAIREALTKEKP